MGLFFPSKPSTPPASSSHPTPHTYGQVTPREFQKEVLAHLRQDGMSKRDRDVVEAAASGYLDKEYGKPGMNFHEKEEFVEKIREEGSKIGLDERDLGRVDDALNRAL